GRIDPNRCRYLPAAGVDYHALSELGLVHSERARIHHPGRHVAEDVANLEPVFPWNVCRNRSFHPRIFLDDVFIRRTQPGETGGGYRGRTSRSLTASGFGEAPEQLSSGTRSSADSEQYAHDRIVEL